MTGRRFSPATAVSSGTDAKVVRLILGVLANSEKHVLSRQENLAKAAHLNREILATLVSRVALSPVNRETHASRARDANSSHVNRAATTAVAIHAPPSRNGTERRP
jgi:hypothetical protein